MGTTFAEVANTALVSLLLGMPRLMIFIVIVPLFPVAVFPQLLRVAMVMGLGAPVEVGVFHQLTQEPRQIELAGVVIKECVLGLLLGFAVAAPIWAVGSVGTLTDNQRGANALQQLTPFAQADSSVLGAALQQALIVVLAYSGAFAMIYHLLLFSFEAWPVLQLVPDVAKFSFELSLMRFTEAIQQTLLLAAPMLAIVLVVDFLFAMIGVFAPQLQTYFAAFPVKSISAIAVLSVCVFSLLSHGESFVRKVLHRETLFLEQVLRGHGP